MGTSVQPDMDEEELVHDIQQAPLNNTPAVNKRKTPSLNYPKGIREFVKKNEIT